MTHPIFLNDSPASAAAIPESSGAQSGFRARWATQRDRSYPRPYLVPMLVGALVVCWAAINLALGWVGFAVIVPVGFRGSGEAAISLARLFAAGVLILMATGGEGSRLRWIAAGFAVLGSGQLLFGYLEPILDSATGVNDALIQMVLVRTLGAALIVVGLLPSTVPRLTRGGAIAGGLVWVATFASYWLLKALDLIPELVRIESLDDAARERIAPMSWLTGWHWLLAAIPLGLAIVAAAGASRLQARGHVGAWLPLSIVLLAGSEVHDALWPSAYGTTILFTSADFLRLAMAAVVVAGGTLELRHIAANRADLLAAERRHAQRLEELAILKRDLTATIAHELGHPLSGIRRLAEVLRRDGIDPATRQQMLVALIRETDTLDHLVADVQDTASLESGVLAMRIRPVAIGSIFDDARSTLDTFHRDPPVVLELHGIDVESRVDADRERVGQVLRNLVCNAEKFSPPGTRIAIEAHPTATRRVRFAVVDEGPGIPPADAGRIFEKFSRGQDATSRQIPGAGLGLYVSRRIARAHGSDLGLAGNPGGGSVFHFDLRLCGRGDSDA
jgi:signal transduction histidine kinase